MPALTPNDSESQTRAASKTYRENTTLRIREHLPPKPFTGDYGPNPRPDVDWTPWKNLPHWKIDRVEFALANPPIETEPPAGPERTLTIARTLTRPSDGGPNVVTCFLDGDMSVEYVAKIYDGVDYLLSAWDDGTDAGKGGNLDCMKWADRDYSIEAWAYRIMQPVIGNTGIVPTYHGSWTFALQTDQPGRQRWVRMILVDLIEGECILDVTSRAEKEPGSGKVDYGCLPSEEFRLRVLQNILEAQFTIWWEAAILHNDAQPRNIMVKPDGRIVIIDFNQATVYDFIRSNLKHPKRINPDSLPLTPIEWQWPLPERFEPWAKWVPEPWVRNEELGAEWLILKYRDAPGFRPPTARFLNRPIHAHWSRQLQRLLEGLGRKPTGDQPHDGRSP